MTGLVVQPLHGAMTIFLLQRKSFHEFCGINLVFSISFVVIWHAVLGHSDLMSWGRYLTIKYAFAHNEMFTKTRVIVLSVWRLDHKHSWLLFSESRVMVIPVEVLKVTLYSSIICLQILLYREARRHEKMNGFLTFSFKRERKTLKSTTSVTIYNVNFSVFRSANWTSVRPMVSLYQGKVFGQW